MALAAGAEVKWETSEIKWAFQGLMKVYFWADAIGPAGSYNAGESSRFYPGYGFASPRQNHKNTVIAHSELIALLVGKGWEASTNSGSAWYSTRFRRRLAT
jgi:hypothetical protein